MTELHKKHNQKGFTLIELIVVITIIGILSISLATFITTWLQSSNLAQAHDNLLSSAESAMDTMTNDVQLSGSVDENNRWADPNGPGGQFGWVSNNQTLILAKVATDSNNNIIFSDPAEYISQKDDEIYFLSGTTLYRRTLASSSSNDAAVTTCPPASATKTCPADKVIATGVSNWNVTYYADSGGVASDTDDARSVQVTITMSSVIDAKTISASYTTRMVFRNE